MAKLVKKSKAERVNIDPKKESKKELLDAKIRDINNQIRDLKEEREKLLREILEIDLEPFKVGDYVLAEVSSGRSKKEQKCLIECELGICYLRPVKADGELSGRHFSLMPTTDKTYADYLKEVD